MKIGINMNNESTAYSSAHAAAFMDNAEQDLLNQIKKWNQFDEDYSNAQHLLLMVSNSLKKEVMVPVVDGGIAFMPGYLDRTNQVLASLGSNYFADMTVHRAIELIQRRREFLKESQSNLQDALQNVQAKKNLLQATSHSDLGLPVHALDEHGNALNEEGLAFVDIREELSDHADEGIDEHPDESNAHRMMTRSEVDERVKEMDAFDRNLLERIRHLELEEDESQEDDVIEVYEDSSHDYTEEGESTDSEVTQLTKANTAANAATSSKPAKNKAAVSNTVVERVDSDESFEGDEIDEDEESDAEEYIRGQHLAIEYQKKRQRLIAAGILRPGSLIEDASAGIDETNITQTRNRPSQPPSIAMGSAKNKSQLVTPSSSSSSSSATAATTETLEEEKPPLRYPPKISRFRQARNQAKQSDS